MNIIVQDTGEYASSLNGKSEISNKTHDNIIRAIILNSSNKKEFWDFAYQYAICISLQNENTLHGDVTSFFWYGIRLSYKHIKKWDARANIINGHVTRKKLNDRPHRDYFIVYLTTTGVILCWKPDHSFIIHRSHHVSFDEYNYLISIEYNHTSGYLQVQKHPESLLHNSDPLNLIPC